MEDIEVKYRNQLGTISRPFSKQLKARETISIHTYRDENNKLHIDFRSDPVREFLQSKVQRIQAVDYPVVGVDVSEWQGTIDWAKLASKVYFVFIRAGYGNTYRDSKYNSNLSNAHSKGRGVGIYWYVKPNNNSNWRNHLDTIVPIYKDSGSQIPMVLDVEETALNKTDTTAWVYKLQRDFEDRTGVSPIIYTSAGWWNYNTYRNDWAKQLTLWVAHWTTADSPIIPNDWALINNPKTWTFWQWSSKGIGADYGVSSASIDLNRYHYSLIAFNSQFKMNLPSLDTTPVPPPEPPPVTDIITPLYQVEVTADNLNVRAGNGVEYSDIGTLKGTSQVGTSQVPVISENGDWLEVRGFIHKDYTRRI